MSPTLSKIVPLVALCTLPFTSHAQTPAITGIVNAASYGGNLAPGALASIFGTNLAPSVAQAPSLPLPMILNGISVKVGGLSAPLWYVSGGQINLLIPPELTPTQPPATVPVIVTTAAGSSAAFNIALNKAAPALFAMGTPTGQAVAFNASAPYNAVTMVGAGPIALYATGLGATNPPASSTAAGAGAEPLNRVVDNVAIFIGDKPATVGFAGLTPGYQGFYQLNITPNGTVSDRVYVQVDGWQSNIASIPVPQGANVTNVTASIAGLYPSSSATPSTSGPIATSVMLMAGSFSGSFDIAPNAQPFSIVATSEGGTAEIDIDPVKGTWTETESVPTPASRNGDFSKSEFIPVLDFMACTSPESCSPFPNDIVPALRWDPLALQAQNRLPLPSASSNTATAPYVLSGTLTGTHVDLSTFVPYFGGYLQVPPFGQSTRTTTFHLYIDGKLVASKDVNYSVL